MNLAILMMLVPRHSGGRATLSIALDGHLQMHLQTCAVILGCQQRHMPPSLVPFMPFTELHCSTLSFQTLTEVPYATSCVSVSLQKGSAGSGTSPRPRVSRLAPSPCRFVEGFCVQLTTLPKAYKCKPLGNNLL